jgi:AraC family transcriptional regulator
VDHSSYLVLNSGHKYTLAIDSRESVETFCLFFRRGLIEDVYQVQSTGPASLLDDPVSANIVSTPQNISATALGQLGSRVEFFETLHPHDSTVSPLIRRMYSQLKLEAASEAWLEDQFLAVAAALSKMHAQAGKRAARIPAKKSSTRIELYRRLLRGKDYLDSFWGDQVHLEEVARQACLSTYHFHRLFCEVFRETPNQYLQRKRLVNARRLLERSEQSVTDICLEVGFESVTSFSGLFRRNFGCSPREYRSRNVKLPQRPRQRQ